MPAEPVDPFDEDRGQAIRDGGDRHAGRGYCETDVPEKSTHAVTRRSRQARDRCSSAPRYAPKRTGRWSNAAS